MSADEEGKKDSGHEQPLPIQVHPSSDEDAARRSDDAPNRESEDVHLTNNSDVRLGVSESKNSLDVSPKYLEVSYQDIFRQFILLGWTAFGGPAAHIALFQKIFIERLNWMSHSLFMELFALGQCLPGPTSTQVSFAIGVVKKGILGGLLSGMLFQYPGLLMMSVIGYAADQVDWQNGALKGFASGLGAVGVALVAGAALTLSQKTCPDRETRILNLIAAVLAYMFSSAWIFPSLIAFGGLVTLIRERNNPVKEAPGNEGIESLGVKKVTGAILLIVWISVLVIAIVLRTSVIKYEGSGRVLWWFESFYRTGSIIFGGGQVVLPLLVQEVVQYKDLCAEEAGKTVCSKVPDYTYYGSFSNPNVQSWMTEEQFLAGLGIAQAMPGPLFNIAAYLGALTASQAGVNAIVGVCATWFGLFGPGVLVIFGTLPFWGVFRKQPVYRRALPGMNAAAVGLIVAAVFSLYDKVRQSSPFPDTAVAIGLIGFVLVEIFKAPAPLAIVIGGILGIFGWAVKLKWVAG